MKVSKVVEEKVRFEADGPVERSVFFSAMVIGDEARISLPANPEQACVWIRLVNSDAAAVLEDLARRLRRELEEREQRALQTVERGGRATTDAMGGATARAD